MCVLLPSGKLGITQVRKRNGLGYGTVHQEEVISQEREEEEGNANAEMMEEEEHENGEPSGPQGVAETEEVPPLVSTGDAVSPEEDAFLI